MQTRDGVTPPHMAGRPIVRVGLLLPFSLRPQDAAALYSAAELALFDHGDQNTLLIPRDAGSTEAEAAAAARALVNDGADIIIGPVLREGVAGAASAVRANNIPVIGFSSDRTVAGNGVYLLSFQLEDEVSRMIAFAASRNLRSIALIAPSNEYGRRVEQTFREVARQNNVAVPAVELYSRSDAEATAAAGRLAATLRANPAQAVMIADSGGPLRAIAGALTRAGVDPRQVRFMGTSAWAGEAQREPSLNGGWYVTTDPAARADYEGRYQTVFSREPTRLSSLAYDAVALASLLSRDSGARGFSRTGLENSDGFMGSDGLFRFRADGALERGLAIMEVRGNAVAPLEAAPRRFPGATG
ncbi:ABC-type branched-chain amino acid transport systems periplasmic component [alpha proteobacterium U9-1i]|nr:ABC-type branched-chain amino acid transport systems periplasmic component [alpha proteobacterium U9-1i]